MYLPKLIDIASAHVVTLADSRSIDEAVHLMAERHLRDVIITGDAGLRILTTRELIGFQLQNIDFELPLHQVMLNTVPTLHPEASILQALDVIRNHPDEHLCLVDSAGELVGIVSYSDLASCLNPETLLQVKTLSELVSPGNLVRVQQNQSVEQVFGLLNHAQQTAAVVFDGERPVGMITQSDIIKLFDEHANLNLTAQAAMSSPLQTFTSDLSLSHAIEQARFHKIKRLVVVDAKTGEASGVLHQKDLVTFVYQSWSKRIAYENQYLKMERDLFAGGPVLVFKWQPTAGRPVEFVSPNIVDILGFSAESVLAKNFTFNSLIHPLDSARVEAEAAQFLAEKRVFWEQEYRLVNAQGQCRWFYDYTRPVYDEKGVLLEILRYLIDQTDTKHAHHRLQALANNLPGMLYELVRDASGHFKFSFASPMIVDLFNFTFAEVEKDAGLLFERVHPEDVPAIMASIEASAKSLSLWSQNFRVVLGGGSIHWLSAQSTPTSCEDGSIIWHGFVHDITEQKQQQLALEKTNQQFNLTMQATLIGRWSWDMRTNQIEWSGECFEQLGYEPQAFEVSLQVFQAMMHPDDLAPMFSAVETQMAKNASFVVDFRVKNAQGGWSWIQGRGHITQADEQGLPIFMMGTHLEVTVQKELQLQTERQNRMLQSIWQANQTFITTQDIHQTSDILLSEILRFTQSDLGFIGEVLYDEHQQPYLTIFSMHHTTSSPETSELYRRVKSEGLEFRNLNNLFGQVMLHQKTVVSNDPATDPRAGGLPPGHPELERFLGVPVFYGAEMVGFLGLANAPFDYCEQDAEALSIFCQNFSSLIFAKRLQTQQTLLNEALKVERDKAEAANKAKSEFLANMSHEIRTPMNGILGLSELGLKQNDPEKMRDQFSKVHYSGQLLMGIINDLLDFSKIEAGKLVIDAQPFAIDRFFEHLYNLFAPSALDKHLTLHLDIPTLDQTWLCADELRLRQVLSNLLSNAIKFTEQGEVCLKVTFLEVKNNQAWLKFAVKDTGIGLTQEQATKLFKAFSQADSSVTRKYGGTGLGLVISQRLVDLMGGNKIELDTQPNVGSTFSFTLPLRICTPEQLKPVLPQASVTVQIEGHVLLVEDNEINQEVAKELLKQMGLQVSLAKNGQQAVEQVQQHTFDLVLMDIQMPIMDGYQATQIIRTFKPNLPIIALTAAAMVEDRIKALDAGMNDHLSKPLNSADLQKILSQYLAVKTKPLSSLSDNTAADLQLESAPSQSTQSMSSTAAQMLDVSAGLARLNDNQALYQKLLQRFQQQLQTEFVLLVQQLADLHASQADSASEAFIAAQHLNHTLKGVAGNLSITGLFDISQTIDALLKNHQLPNESQLNALAKAMDSTQAEITQYLANLSNSSNLAAESSPLPQPLTEIAWDKTFLQQLKQRIVNSEFIDETELIVFGQGLPAQLKAPWQALMQSIDAFNFERAEQQLDELTQIALKE